MKSYLDLLAWADGLIECGQRGEVGAGMIDIIKEKIREAYQNGFQDGSVTKNLPARRHKSSRRVSGPKQ